MEIPWGNYVYNVTDYVTGNGTYIVTVERTGGSKFSIAAHGIVYVYEDENAPTIEYWINEGADVLIGGRRGDGGYLAWWECINNATFPASTGTGDVAGATLGVVSPWGDSVTDDILFFNEIELGIGVYHGYSSPYEGTIDGMSMYIGSTNAQVGVNMTNVKAQYVHESENMVSQADDGDNMMPGNAFLVVQYEKVITTYDFATNASIDRWAYRYQNNTKPPAANDVPSVEFATDDNPNKDQYVKISTDNRKMQSDSTDQEGYYAAHRFVFDIAEQVGDIEKIGVLWNGKGTHTDRNKAGATLYIWNGTAYEPLNTTDSTREVYLTGDVTTGIGNYIDASTGNLTILIEQNYNQTMKGKKELVSKISTDYVKVDITHT